MYKKRTSRVIHSRLIRPRREFKVEAELQQALFHAAGGVVPPQKSCLHGLRHTPSVLATFIPRLLVTQPWSTCSRSRSRRRSVSSTPIWSSEVLLQVLAASSMTCHPHPGFSHLHRIVIASTGSFPASFSGVFFLQQGPPPAPHPPRAWRARMIISLAHLLPTAMARAALFSAMTSPAGAKSGGSPMSRRVIQAP